MDNNKISLKMMVKLDQDWASRFSSEDLKEQITVRVNNALGFRGQVKNIEISKN